MSRKKKQPTPTDEGLACPKCGSRDIGGLMQSFFVALGDDGSPKGRWADWCSETELGTERVCYQCSHEWSL